MNVKKILYPVAVLLVVAGVVFLSDYVISGSMAGDRPAADAGGSGPAIIADEAMPGTGAISLGKFRGSVSYNSEEDLYVLALQGARFPFKTSPKAALEVELDAPGEDDLEKNTSLLYGLLGPDVRHATLLIDPAEEAELGPAIADLATYIQIAGPGKFAGLAYTRKGGELERSVIRGEQIQSLDTDATLATPLVLLRGPKGGAEATGVKVLGGGRFIVEGETYEDVYKAADFVCMTLIKMLCGSQDCPDASACATGGDCGCG